MSKGHMEALAALKAMRKNPWAPQPPLPEGAKIILPQKLESVTQPETVTRGGRGKKVHASAAQKQKAYRERKKAKA